MYKALVTDIDGTVTAIGGDGSDITQSTKHAVKQARIAGKKIACATGRGWKTAKPVVVHLGFVDPCIIEGGSCIIEPLTGRVLWEMQLSAQESQKILDIFKRVAGDKGLVKSTLLPDRTELTTVDSFQDANRVIYLMRLDAETAQSVKNAVNQTGFAVAHSTTPSWYGAEFTDVHVTNPEGTKEHAIVAWQQMMNVTKEETIGLGDGENDIPIFQSVGRSVAVGNAHPNLKQHADQVVASYAQGGLEEVINELLLK